MLTRAVRMRELALRASPALTLRDTAMPFRADAPAVLGQHVQLGLRAASAAASPFASH